MALVNTGTRRSMTMVITKKGTDNSTVVMSPTSTPAYPALNGRAAFGSFQYITEEEMQELSNVDFNTRLNAWKLNVQSEFALSDPDLYDDISDRFKYSTEQLVRIYDTGLTSLPLTIAATIYPTVAQEDIVVGLFEVSNGINYTFTIPAGSSSSTGSRLSVFDTMDDIDQGLTTGDYEIYINSYSTGTSLETTIARYTVILDPRNSYPIPQ